MGYWSKIIYNTHMFRKPSNTFEKQIILFSAGIISLSINGAISLREYYTTEDISKYSGFFMIGITSFLVVVIFSLMRLYFSQFTSKDSDFTDIKNSSFLKSIFLFMPSVIIFSFLIGLLLISCFFIVNLFDFGLSTTENIIIYKSICILGALYLLIAAVANTFFKKNK